MSFTSPVNSFNAVPDWCKKLTWPNRSFVLFLCCRRTIVRRSWCDYSRLTNSSRRLCSVIRAKRGNLQAWRLQYANRRRYQLAGCIPGSVILSVSFIPQFYHLLCCIWSFVPLSLICDAFLFIHQVIARMEKLLDMKLRERNKENTERKKAVLKPKGVSIRVSSLMSGIL